MKARKKFIILEHQTNLREVIIFNLESHFNVEAIRVNNFEEAYDTLQTISDISFIFCGNLANTDDRERIYNAYIVSGFNKAMAFYDFSDRKNILNFNQIKVATKLDRKSNIGELLGYMEKDFKIDLTIPKEEYTAISMETLQFLNELKSCLYIKLTTGRFLKLFQTNDVVNENDILKYQSKGVQWMYLQKDAYTWINNQIESQYGTLLANPQAKLKLTKPIETRELAPNKIKFEGIDLEFDLDLIYEIPEQIEVMKNRLKKNIVLKDLLKNLLGNKRLENFIETRTNLVIYFSCALAKELDWTSQKITEKLIYCAMTHDILLYNYPKVLIYDALGKIEKDMNNFTKFEKEIFLQHPELTLKIIEKDAQAPKEAYDIIEQHHETFDGMGFPYKIDYKRINALSAIFNISLDLANALMKDSKMNFQTYIALKKIKVKGEAFKKAINALDRIIKKNQL